MPRDRVDIEKSLLKKGFVEVGGDHQFFHFYVDGKFTGIHTKLSRGTKYKVYDDSLLSKMWKQLKLDSKKELLQLIDCPMNEEQYRGKLQDKGFC